MNNLECNYFTPSYVANKFCVNVMIIHKFMREDNITYIKKGGRYFIVGDENYKKLENDYELLKYYNEKHYNAKQVADLFDVSRATVYRWAELGKFDPIKIINRTFFHKNQIDKIVNEMKSAIN